MSSPSWWKGETGSFAIDPLAKFIPPKSFDQSSLNFFSLASFFPQVILGMNVRLLRFATLHSSVGFLVPESRLCAGERYLRFASSERQFWGHGCDWQMQNREANQVNPYWGNDVSPLFIGVLRPTISPSPIAHWWGRLVTRDSPILFLSGTLSTVSHSQQTKKTGQLCLMSSPCEFWKYYPKKEGRKRRTALQKSVKKTIRKEGGCILGGRESAI